MISLTEVVQSAPYCVVGHPKFKDEKNGYVYGVPATGDCPAGEKEGKIQYIIPVEGIDVAPDKAEEKNVYSLGLYDPKKFHIEAEPLQTYLEKRNIPDYIKFLFINSKDVECNKQVTNN